MGVEFVPKALEAIMSAMMPRSQIPTIVQFDYAQDDDGLMSMLDDSANISEMDLQGDDSGNEISQKCINL